MVFFFPAFSCRSLERPGPADLIRPRPASSAAATDPDAPANTVAWINPKAYSAGTIIALACREIVVSPNSAFGDAAPISPFGPIPITERAKIESPLLI